MEHLITSEISAFLTDRRARSLSPATIKFYDIHLDLLARYLTSLKVLSVPEISSQHLRQYFIRLADTRSPGGIHASYRACKSFFNWYTAEYDSATNPMKKVSPPRLPQKTLDPLPTDDLRKMLATCDKSYTGVRDKAAMLFLFDTGLRRNEFLGLNIPDIDQRTGAVQVQSGKGNKGRVVYLGARSLRELQKYLRIHPDSSALWVTQSGSRLKPPGLRQMIRRRAQAASVPVPQIHDFRRAFAIASLRNGADLFTIMRLMGHTSTAVLQRYIKLLPEDLSAIHARTSPGDNL